jgi:hypothetical protein
MLEEYEKKRQKQLSLMRSILDYGMGIIIFLLGLFFLFRDQFKISFNVSFPPKDIEKYFGALCLLYGSWRIYRGYKKKYFR